MPDVWRSVQGPGAPLMRLIGKRPSTANPNWCTGCFDYMTKHRGGAEVEGAFLFADIRGSTSLAERLSSSEYHGLLERYFAAATSAVFKYDGFVDKFVGDELVALFYPLLTGERFAERAVDAAKEVLRATGTPTPAGRGSRWVSACTRGSPGSGASARGPTSR